MLKKFNLEEFKAGKLALTRDGRIARFIATFNHRIFPVAVVIEEDGYEILLTVSLDGSSCYGAEVGSDLVSMKPEILEHWVNVYRNPETTSTVSVYTLGTSHPTKEKAMADIIDKEAYLKTVLILTEEI